MTAIESIADEVCHQCENLRAVRRTPGAPLPETSLEGKMMKRTALMITLFLAVSLIGGCKKPAEEEAAEETAAPAKPLYKSDGNEGTITGKISFVGEPPPPRKIDMKADAQCAVHNPNAVYENVVVKDGKLANVFVYLKGGGAVDNYSFETPSAEVTLDQKGCIYHPRVLGIQVNQTLAVTNSDPTTHNIHPRPKNNRDWNKSQAPNAPPIKEKFSRPETLIHVKCDIHPWMSAYIGVLPHPFFAVSGEDGSYTIKGVPPGTYKLVAWHEEYGEQSFDITVGAKETKTQDFSFSPKKAYAPTSLRTTTLVLPYLGGHGSINDD